ncbi:aromatic acid exporter family member 1 [Paenibacillus taihuensis]|uniref:Aromatic acid exporter family member 1 n=1 Tax=Paenibacillus taihuensis TaxID=1156355 RepID=A0A3D9QVB9_9BACL|nr:aromatic acid exporter family protein [Paenibacillus taihuensis]REE68096.1 aromatic acid exporter family member 1 [Paenibacillus taihuensis]
MKLSLEMLTRYGLTLQIGKTALSSALAWELASHLSFNNYPYFAPLAAILTVQVTVADSLEKAMQRTMGIILGVIISLLIGHWLSAGILSIFIVILIGMAIPKALRLNDQIATQVAVSSLLVLAFGHNQGYALGRIVETVIGSAVAVAVNAFIIPPNAVPSAEASLFQLSKRAASALHSFVKLYRQESSPAHDDEAVERLIDETGVSLQQLQLAKQSQKFSPFRSKERVRLEAIGFGMNQLEKVTIQIRGIRRSLIELREIEEYNVEYPRIERIFETFEATAACIEHFGETIIHNSTASRSTQRSYVERAQSLQLACLHDMTGVHSPLVLREIGGILVDLNRIVKEVSSNEMNDNTDIVQRSL